MKTLRIFYPKFLKTVKISDIRIGHTTSLFCKMRVNVRPPWHLPSFRRLAKDRQEWSSSVLHHRKLCQSPTLKWGKKSSCLLEKDPKAEFHCDPQHQELAVPSCFLRSLFNFHLFLPVSYHSQEPLHYL